jgi:hypothetical protein
MRRTLGLVLVGLASLVAGVIAWLVLAWVLSAIADRVSSNALEFTLALVSPVAFGPLFALVLAVVAFVLAVRFATVRHIIWLGFAPNPAVNTDAPSARRLP